MNRPIAALCFAIAALAHSTAFGYCRTTTCAQKDPPQECVPGALVGTCQTAGTALFWPTSCAAFSVNADGSAAQGISADELQSLIRLCFDNWQKVPCPNPAGTNPNILIDTFPQVECSEVRYNKDGPNQNLWVFRDKEWPHDDPSLSMIALTSVLFSPSKGEIYDVDVELNSATFLFKAQPASKGDFRQVTDLQSVIQHESGHFLGLAHSDVSAATMWAAYGGSSDMRVLKADDAAGICAAYPPLASGTTNKACDTTPRHGFSTACAGDSSGCSMANVGSRNATNTRWWIMVFGLVALGLRRTRQRS
jgi:hypothetical protein